MAYCPCECPEPTPWFWGPHPQLSFNTYFYCMPAYDVDFMWMPTTPFLHATEYFRHYKTDRYTNHTGIGLQITSLRWEKGEGQSVTDFSGRLGEGWNKYFEVRLSPLQGVVITWSDKFEPLCAVPDQGMSFMGCSPLVSMILGPWE